MKKRISGMVNIPEVTMKMGIFAFVPVLLTEIRTEDGQGHVMAVRPQKKEGVHGLNPPC